MKNTTVIPEYREVAGLWYDYYGRPLMISDPNLSFINQLRLRQGVTELEGIAAGTGPLFMPVANYAEIIRANLGVEVGLFQFSPSSVKQVLTNIKFQLLDRIAQQREKISDIPEVQIPQEAEILQLKPTIYGVGIDLKALWRRAFRAAKDFRSRP